MRRLLVLCGIIAAGALFLGRVHAQKPAVDQWPNYQANSNFSPLTQITPQNVSRLAKAWTFNYGAGSMEDGGFVSLDYRFSVQPLVIDGVMYITTPASQQVPDLMARSHCAWFLMSGAMPLPVGPVPGKSLFGGRCISANQ